MAKKKSIRPKGTIVGPQPVDLGHSVSVTVKKSYPESIELLLSDGTKLELKPVVLGIDRSTEKYNPTGDPIYQLNIGIMISTKVPKKLKLKS
jgi:hypothetical protein